MQNRRSKLLVVAVVVVIVVISASAVVLRGRLRCSGFAGPQVTGDELPPAADENALRIASWNLRNFPLDERPQAADLAYSRRTNICDLETALGGLDADLMALQEVCDTRRFPPILQRACAPRTVRVLFSAGGGRFGQHLALAWDEAALELLGQPVEIDGLVLEPGMRPGFAAMFRSRRQPGLDFTVVTVHLESGRTSFSARRRQNRALVEWINDRVEEIGDPDVIVLGDFNTAGSPRGGFEGELQSMDAILRRAGLERLENTTGCTEYWEGAGDRDGVLVPSLLDFAFVGGAIGSAVVTPLQAWLHCSRAQCGELVSRPGAEDGTFWDVSDHCPLTFEIRDANFKGQNEE